MPGVEDTVNIPDTKKHYFGSHTSLNPHRVVPLGPAIDFHAPHGRDEAFPVKERFARRDHNA